MHSIAYSPSHSTPKFMVCGDTSHLPATASVLLKSPIVYIARDVPRSLNSMRPSPIFASMRACDPYPTWTCPSPRTGPVTPMSMSERSDFDANVTIFTVLAVRIAISGATDPGTSLVNPSMVTYCTDGSRRAAYCTILGPVIVSIGASIGASKSTMNVAQWSRPCPETCAGAYHAGSSGGHASTSKVPLSRASAAPSKKTVDPGTRSWPRGACMKTRLEFAGRSTSSAVKKRRPSVTRLKKTRAG